MWVDLHQKLVWSSFAMDKLLELIGNVRKILKIFENFGKKLRCFFGDFSVIFQTVIFQWFSKFSNEINLILDRWFFSEKSRRWFSGDFSVIFRTLIFATKFSVKFRKFLKISVNFWKFLKISENFWKFPQNLNYDNSLGKLRQPSKLRQTN